MLSARKRAKVTPTVEPKPEEKDTVKANTARRRASVYSIGNITVDETANSMEGQLARLIKAAHSDDSGRSSLSTSKFLIFDDRLLEFAFLSKMLRDFRSSAIACFFILVLVTGFFALMDYIDSDLLKGHFTWEMLVPRTLMPIICIIATAIAASHNWIFRKVVRNLKHRRGEQVLKLVKFQYWSFAILAFLNLAAITPLYFFKLHRYYWYTLENCAPVQAQAEAAAEAANISLPVLTMPLEGTDLLQFVRRNVYSELAEDTKYCILTEVFDYTSSERNIYVGVVSLYAGTSLALPIRFRENIWILLPSSLSICLVLALERIRFPIYAVSTFNFAVEDTMFGVIPMVALSLLLLLAIYHRESRGRREFILERIVQTEKLLKAKAEVERKQRLNDMRMKFFSNVAHEIRTPIHGIRGLADLLIQSGKLDVESKGYMEAINVSGDTIHGIINDILDLVKMEATEFRLKEGEFNPMSTAETIVSTLYPTAAKKHVELVCNADASADLVVSGDESRFVQVINNLLSNSVKFSEPLSTVVVQVWAECEDEEGDMRGSEASMGSANEGDDKRLAGEAPHDKRAALMKSNLYEAGGDEGSEKCVSDEAVNVRMAVKEGKREARDNEEGDHSTRTMDENIAPTVVCYLRVSDEGIGIPKKMQGRLFQRFFQALDADSNKTQGSGLGLSIVHELCKAMGGGINLKSVEGQGSEFTASFKFTKARGTTNQRLSESSATSLIQSRLKLPKKVGMTERELNAQLRLNGINENFDAIEEEEERKEEEDDIEQVALSPSALKGEREGGEGGGGGSEGAVKRRMRQRLSSDRDVEATGSTVSTHTIKGHQAGRLAMSSSSGLEGDLTQTPDAGSEKARQKIDSGRACIVFSANSYIREILDISFAHLALSFVQSKYFTVLHEYDKKVADIRKKRTGGKGGTEMASLALPQLDKKKLNSGLLSDYEVLHKSRVIVFDISAPDEAMGMGKLEEVLTNATISAMKGRQVLVFTPPNVKLSKRWDALGTSVIPIGKPVTAVKLRKVKLMSVTNGASNAVLSKALNTMYTGRYTPDSAIGSDDEEESGGEGGEGNRRRLEESGHGKVENGEKQRARPPRHPRAAKRGDLPAIQEGDSNPASPLPGGSRQGGDGMGMARQTPNGSITTGGSTRGGKLGYIRTLEEKRILLVDDDKLNHVILKSMLTGLGATKKFITVATNGQEAVECVMSGSYDLIFMDYHMPLMSGPEAAENIREKGYKTPIIGMTAAVDQEEVMDLIQSGMNCCMSKPFDKFAVRKALMEVMSAMGPTPPQSAGRFSPLGNDPFRPLPGGGGGLLEGGKVIQDGGVVTSVLLTDGDGRGGLLRGRNGSDIGGDMDVESYHSGSRHAVTSRASRPGSRGGTLSPLPPLAGGIAGRPSLSEEIAGASDFLLESVTGGGKRPTGSVRRKKVKGGAGGGDVEEKADKRSKGGGKRRGSEVEVSRKQMQVEEREVRSPLYGGSTNEERSVSRRPKGSVNAGPASISVVQPSEPGSAARSPSFARRSAVNSTGTVTPVSASTPAQAEKVSVYPDDPSMESASKRSLSGLGVPPPVYVGRASPDLKDIEEVQL